MYIDVYAKFYVSLNLYIRLSGLQDLTFALIKLQFKMVFAKLNNIFTKLNNILLSFKLAPSIVE